MTKKNSSKLLISSSAKKTIRDSILLAKELNTGIEISRLPLYKDENLTEERVIEQLKNDLAGFENRITVHAMFSDVNVAGGDCLLREISRKRCQQSFDIAKEIGADTVLFHTGNKGTRHYGSQEQFKTKYIKFWKEFIKQFEETGIIAVVENVFEKTPNYCLELFSQINSPNYKLALDTGHVNLYAKETKVIDWVKAYGKNLYHMHIHNNFRENDDHANLSNGTLDFYEIFNCLKETQASPSFVFEMYSEEDIRNSYKFFNEINN
ncbi:sugar phosphate isomerase/epimerase [bacterium]|nr:sugar phosphate isomerase/epimerase [bacterium]